MRIAVRLTAKLVRKLVALGVLLAVVVGALGGAAALGSTLFESPPRDAAELARRAAEAREEADGARRTAAESRFARRLGSLCARQRRQREALGDPVPTGEIPAWFRRTKPVARRHVAELAALAAPRSYRDERHEAIARRERSLVLWGRLSELVRAGERDSVEAMIAAIGQLDAEAGALLAAAGGAACAER